MGPIPILILGGVVFYLYEKDKNPAWSPFARLLATPVDKVVALEKVKVTSVPTPSAAMALDPNMSSAEVEQVNSVLTTETDPKKIAAHAIAHDAFGNDNSARALAAKANAVAQAKAMGASDVDIHKKQIEAAAETPPAAAVGWEPWRRDRHHHHYWPLGEEAVLPEFAGWGPYIAGFERDRDSREMHGRSREMHGRGHPMHSRGREMHGEMHSRGHPMHGEMHGRSRGMHGEMHGRGHGMHGMYGRGHGMHGMYGRGHEMQFEGQEEMMPEVPEEGVMPHHRHRHHHRHLTEEQLQQQQLAEQGMQPPPMNQGDQGDQGTQTPVGIPLGGGGAMAATAVPAGTDTGDQASAESTQGWWPSAGDEYSYFPQQGLESTPRSEMAYYPPHEPSGGAAYYPLTPVGDFGGYGYIGEGGLGGLGGYGSWGSFGGWGHGL